MRPRKLLAPPGSASDEAGERLAGVEAQVHCDQTPALPVLTFVERSRPEVRYIKKATPSSPQGRRGTGAHS